MMPRVSVLMATYNGARYIRQSINSILAQTWKDFEIIIADDCSTDDTLDVISRHDDPRLRIIRNEHNLGAVGSRNRCFAEARGEYVALLDHDDLSRPHRLQRQVEFLERNPQVVLAGTAAHTLEDGRLAPTRHPRRTSPAVIRWMLHLANPIVCSSVMVRADAVRRLGGLVRDGYDYADDFDLYHRLLSHGEVARLDEPLTIYRLHSTNAFRRHEAAMLENAAKVLVPSYTRWFGTQAYDTAVLMMQHISAGKPAPDTETLKLVRDRLNHLSECLVQDRMLGPSDRDAIYQQADEMWGRVLRATIAEGRAEPGIWLKHLAISRRLPVGDLTRAALKSIPPVRTGHRAWQALKRASVRDTSAPARTVEAFGTEFRPVDTGDMPPTLFVVVDTEAEFNWRGPFSRHLTDVTAIDAIGRGQEIFDRHGLRPVYVVDYPVATQQRSIVQLRGLLERQACFIGAHLHPWTNPPFEEETSMANSFPGNLPASLEGRKLASLIAAIRRNFGVEPLYYKAGRYGLGAATLQTLRSRGVRVDFSVLAGADLRPVGGPDFEQLDATPYLVGDGGLVSVPMTRGSVGALGPLRGVAAAMRRWPPFERFKVASVLSRLRLLDTIVLTPEGTTASEQIRLAKAMLRRGTRAFVLHYHSPSLSPGHTPYVRDSQELAEFLQRLRDVCHFFFQEVGAMPGYPPDLLALPTRL